MSAKKYAVIGHPIGHTMSPFIHKNLFAMNNIDASYEVFDIPPEKLSEAFKNTLCKLSGFNITIPHKQAIIPFIDILDEKAKLYGSVNTFFNDNGVYRGYTTDPDGFLKALSSSGVSLGGNTVIIGCGGVARTMAYEALIAGSRLSFAIRKDDEKMASELKTEIEKNFPDSKIGIRGIEEDFEDADLLVNATPVGMFPKTDACPVSDKTIGHSKAVFDAVYNPLETKLIKKARANGSIAVGGMSMLVWQAVAAQEKWNSVCFDAKEIDNLCIKCEKELQSR